MLRTWIRYSTPECRDIVREVLSSHPRGDEGLSTQQIYQLALEKFPDAQGIAPPEKFYPPNARGRRGKIPMPVPEPPNRHHPIRSITYLKKIVLEEMAETCEIEKVRILRNGETQNNAVFLSSRKNKNDAWVWRLKAPGDAMKRKKNQDTKSKPANTDGTPESQNMEEKKVPTWATEYSSKRSLTQESSPQPRFHMSWGSHWKGKAGARGIHFASTLLPQLNGQGLIHNEDGPSSCSYESGPLTQKEEEENLELRRGWNNKDCNLSTSPVINQLSQNFHQPRVKLSLDGSGSSGSSRAQFNQTAAQHISIRSPAGDTLVTPLSDQHLQNTAPFETESFGLRPNKIKQRDPPPLAPPRPLQHLSSQNFDLPPDKTSLDDWGPFGLRRAHSEKYTEGPHSFANQQLDARREELDTSHKSNFEHSKSYYGKDATPNHAGRPGFSGIPTGHSDSAAHKPASEPSYRRREEQRTEPDIGQHPQPDLSLYSPGLRTIQHRSSLMSGLRPAVSSRSTVMRSGATDKARSRNIDELPRQSSLQPSNHRSSYDGSFGLRGLHRSESQIGSSNSTQMVSRDESFGLRGSRQVDSRVRSSHDTSDDESFGLHGLQRVKSRVRSKRDIQLNSGDESFGLQRPSPAEGWVKSDQNVQMALCEPLQPPIDSLLPLPEKPSYSRSTASRDNLSFHAWETASWKMSSGGSDAVNRSVYTRSASSGADSPKQSPQTHTTSNAVASASQSDSSRDANSMTPRKPRPVKQSDASASARPIRIPFSERLRQSRMTITEQVISQRISPRRPLQSAIGRLPQLQNHRKPSEGFSIAQALLGSPIVHTVVDEPHQPSSPRPSGLVHNHLKFPTFPNSPANTNTKNKC